MLKAMRPRILLRNGREKELLALEFESPGCRWKFEPGAFGQLAKLCQASLYSCTKWRNNTHGEDYIVCNREKACSGLQWTVTSKSNKIVIFLFKVSLDDALWDSHSWSVQEKPPPASYLAVSFHGINITEQEWKPRCFLPPLLRIGSCLPRFTLW